MRQRLASLLNEYERNESKKQELLLDQDKLEGAVAGLVDQFYTKTKRPKDPSLTKVQRLEESASEDDPVRGLATEITQSYKQNLADPENSEIPAKQMLEELVTIHMTKPGEDGKSRLQKAHERKRLADSAWFGLGGEDESVKKLPLYDEWLTATRQEEKERLDKESYMAGPKDLLEAAAGGAVWGGAVGGIFSGTAAALPGALTGALSMAALEVPVHPIKRALQGTEWYRAREASGSISDKVKILGAELAPYVLTDLGFRKGAVGLAKAGLKYGSTKTPEDAINLLYRQAGGQAGPAAPGFRGGFDAWNLLKTAKSYREGKKAEAILDDVFAKAGRGAYFDFASQMQMGREVAARNPVEEMLMPWKYANRARPQLPEMPEPPVPKKRVPLPFQARGTTSGPRLKEEFLGLSDEAAESAIAGHESGEALEAAITRAKKGQDAIEKSRLRDRIYEREAEAARIGDAIQKGEEGKAARWSAWEKDKEHRKALEEMGKNDELRRKVSKNIARFYGDEFEADVAGAVAKGEGVKKGMEARLAAKTSRSPAIKLEPSKKGYPEPISPMERVEKKGVLERMEGLVGEEDAKALGYGNLKEAEDDLLKFYDELDSAAGDAAENTGKGAGTKALIVPLFLAGAAGLGSILSPDSAEAGVVSQAAKAVGSGVKRMYHGTKSDFLKFNKEKGTHFGTAEAANQRIEPPYGYMIEGEARNPRLLAGHKVIPVDVEYHNPLKLDTDYDYRIAGDIIEGARNSKGTNPELLEKLDQLNWRFKAEWHKYENEIGITDLTREKQHALTVDQFKRLFKLLDDEGYDAIEYVNAVEDKGSISTIMWKENRIKNALTGKMMGLAFPLTLVAGAAGLLSPAEAEAGVIDQTMGKVSKSLIPFLERAKASGMSRDSLVKAVDALHLNSVPVDPANPFKLPRPMQALRIGKAAYDELETLAKTVARTKPLALGVDRLLSPYTFDQIFFKKGFNPSIEVASMQTASYKNMSNGFEVLRNIVGSVPGGLKSAKAARRAVIEEFDPLAKRFSGTIGTLQTIEAQFAIDSKIRDGLKKYASKRTARAAKVAGALQTVEARMTKLDTARQKLLPEAELYKSEWERIASSLADRYPTVRLALAAEDTVDNKFYPWLKGKLSFEEKAAVAHLKEMHNDYALRMQDAGLQVMKDRPYVHHAWHPSWSEEAAKKRLAELDLDIGEMLPYAKVHSRGRYSLPLTPEITYAMERYLPDIEKRIQWAQFWRKGKKDGWYAFMNSNLVKGSDPLRGYFNRLKKASVPAPATTANVWANRYAAFEVLRLIGFAPSVAFKHFFKNVGTWSTLGVRESLSHIGEAGSTAYRSWARKSANRGILKTLGLKGPGIQNKAIDDYVGSFAHTDRMLQILHDLDLDQLANQHGIGAAVDRMLMRVNEKGSIPVGMIEHFDRTHSVLAATEMALKEGMTAKQAVYGIYDTILKNNFLGGALNPGWLREPKIRALFLFQSTPFKILERRLLTAYKSYRTVKVAGQKLKGEQIGEVLRQMQGLKALIKEGEKELKGNIILDALKSETDFFGTPYARQLVKEMVIGGMIVGAGGTLGIDLMPQVGHAPFLNFERHEPTLRTSPVVSAIFETYAKRHEAEKAGEESEFLLTDFMQNWLGKNGVIPITIHKMARISEDDIPEVYKGSWMQYLFSVPSK